MPSLMGRQRTNEGGASTADGLTQALRSAANDVAPPTSGLPPTNDGPDHEDLPQGAMFGRFIVLEKLGAGGMGVVYAAYDPALHRRVALKLLRVDASQDDPAEARMRLLREAQALAQLSHPCVVAIYEVGEHDRDVFIAMELVAGKTLRQWIDAESRPWREVVRVCVDAGRGLAAAHAAGLVHRDFKPANVLVGDDGRVRVMDFGLARASSEKTATLTPDRGGHELSNALLHSDVTSLSVIVGTTAYMAPEQHLGRDGDARSDQYAYCVSVFEALYGVRPMRHNASDPAPPRGTKVPRWLHAVLVRGLQRSPEARYPSMTVLLDALAADPASRRKKVLGFVAAALSLPATAAAAVTLQGQQRSLCSGAELQLTGIWDDGERARMREHVAATGASSAARVWSYVGPKLDEHASEWIQQHRDACAATSVRGEQSSEVLDLRMACLHRAKVKLQTVTEVLGSLDATTIDKGYDVVQGLDPLSRCADLEKLRAQIEPPPADEAAAVDRISEALDRASILRLAALYPEAKAALEEAQRAASTVTYGPVKTWVLLESGQMHWDAGELSSAEAMLRDGLHNAARWQQWREVRRAATALLLLVTENLARPQEGLHYLELARGLAQGQDDPVGAAEFHNNFALVLQMQGKHVEAEAEFRQTLTLAEGRVSPLLAAEVVSNLATCLRAQGKLDEAQREHRRTLVLREKLLGPEHPSVASSLNNLANVLKARGRYEEAEQMHRRALQIRLKAFGPDHPHTAASHLNVGNVLEVSGKYEEAEQMHRQALASWEKMFGPKHVDVALAHHSLGSTLLAAGKAEASELEFRTALAVWHAVLDPEHPYVIHARYGLGRALLARSRYDEAEAQLSLARTHWEKTLAPDHEDLAGVRVRLAEALLQQHRPREALPLAQRAWEVQKDNTELPRLQAETAFMLARVLSSAKGDTDRARALAEQAATLYRAGGDASRAAEVQRWLERPRH